MDTCLACHEAFIDDDILIPCTECNFCYHIGTCCGISEKAYKKMSQVAKKAWIYPTCKTGKARRGNSTTENVRAEVDLAQEIAEIRRMLVEVLTIRENLDTFEIINITISDIETSMQLLSTKYDEVIARMEEQTADISRVEKRMEKHESK